MASVKVPNPRAQYHFLQRRAWKVPRTLEETIAQTPHDFRLAPISHLFTAARIKERTKYHVDLIWPNQCKLHGLGDSFSRMVESVIHAELDLVRTHLQLYRNPKRSRKKSDGPRKPTGYSLFCEEMRSKRPAVEVTGKVRELWRALSVEQKAVYQTRVKARVTTGGKRPPAVKRPALPFEQEEELLDSELSNNDLSSENSGSEIDSD